MAIIRAAKVKGIDVIGISDHNSVENVKAVKRAGKKEGLMVIGGMEITSTEEVHILAFFDKDSDLEALQDIVYENLDGINDERVFGEQVIFDEEDNVIGCNNRLLIGATRLLLEEIVERIHFLGGIAIASHVDRESFSIISQLGFMPEGLPLDGLELSSPGSTDKVRAKLTKDFAEFLPVTFSDAHYLRDVGRVSTSFTMEFPTVEEVKKALVGKNGRSISSYTGYR